eukprot:1154880-Pelagomonas_calceolata.AAC.7
MHTALQQAKAFVLSRLRFSLALLTSIAIREDNTLAITVNYGNLAAAAAATLGKALLINEAQLSIQPQTLQQKTHIPALMHPCLH